MALLDVGTGFTITFLEDKFELRNISSLAHISPKHTLCHLNVHLLEEALQKKKKGRKIRNVCAIVITVCALINTTDCN